MESAGEAASPPRELWSCLVILRPKPTLQQIDAVVEAGTAGGDLEARVSATLVQTGRMRLVLALIIKMGKK